MPDKLAIILCKTESHQKSRQEPLTAMGKWCPREGKLRAMASLSSTGKWYPDQMRKSLGNVGLDILENISLAPVLLFISPFGFLSKLSLGEDGGWYEPNVYIIYCR